MFHARIAELRHHRLKLYARDPICTGIENARTVGHGNNDVIVAEHEHDAFS